MAPEKIQDLLDLAAESDSGHGVLSYSIRNTELYCKKSYRELREEARHNAQLLSRMGGFSKGSVILVHLNIHLDNIVWFWSVLFSGCIPTMSTPFPNDPNQRDRHIAHLAKLLKTPICITSKDLYKDFADTSPLSIVTIETLIDTSMIRTHPNSKDIGTITPSANDPALLMLTSGSTGNAKAVALRHDQVIAAISGKASMRLLPRDGSFLNWVGLDHVAGMIEIHLQSMFLCMDQIHVHTTDLLSSPMLFLCLINRHRVSRSFAPNFFLAKLRRTMEVEKEASEEFDLTCLRFIVTGGEANPVETCVALSTLLVAHGAPENVIAPGFGMTETCAGAIYNFNCPADDLQTGHEFANLGQCIRGINMRVTVPSEPESLARPYSMGNLEVSGAVVFREYFNDKEATSAAFTSGGWFRTGDQAFIDSKGRLHLAGRDKEQIIINGLKYSPHQVENALEAANIPGITPSYTLCFSYWPQESETEQICVVYLPAYSPENDEIRMEVANSISRLVSLETGALPYVLPLDASRLQKSTLGKISRARVRTAFESGVYKEYQEINDGVGRAYRISHATTPSTDMEALLLQEFEKALGSPSHELGIDNSFFERGVTSIDLIKMTSVIERRLALSTVIPMGTMMANPTIRLLARALGDLDANKEFNPVVTLQHNGFKTPLWLVHPGVGEVLVFLPLAKYFLDRPLHALRARGFNADQHYFSNIAEAVMCYHTAIKKIQPAGPYAIAGYSYGAMLAFETSKVLESNGDSVRFLGSFNLPPHIKARMQQLNWTECLLNLAYFLDLITEQRAQELSPILHDADRLQVLDRVFEEATSARLAELSLTPDALSKWAGVAYSLQSMARNYEPQGSVETMDVFYCHPLAMVASTKEEWLAGPLSMWGNFVRTEPKFHEVGGAHYTMIGAEHVCGFQKTLKAALRDRNL